MEIERKFLVKHLPQDLNEYKNLQIEQGYLCTKPVVRIRKSNDEYYMTYKSKGNIDCSKEQVAIINEEVEFPLSKEAYLHLRNKVDGNIIQKIRYIIPLEDGLNIELDVFEGKLKGLFFAEVEFPDEEAAKHFTVPEWFLQEVSFDKRFRNSYLIEINSLDELNLNIG